MRNRIIITSKIDDLLQSIHPEMPKVHMKNLSLSQDESVESKIISHLKIRLDDDAIKSKFVQEKTRSLAHKIKLLKQQTQLKKVQLPSEYKSFLNSIQESLIQQQETRINKILKRQQQYEEQNRSAQQFRIKALEKQQQQIEQKHTELPLDFKSFYQPIEEAAANFNNMDQRMKVQLEHRAKRKFYSFWSNLHTPTKTSSNQTMNQSQSYFLKPKKRVSIQQPMIQIKNI